MRFSPLILASGLSLLPFQPLGAINKGNAGPVNPEIKFNLPPPPVLSVAEQLQTFKLAPGFRMEAVAAEPLVDSPVAISFDDQGRMYVVEMRSYMRDMEGNDADKPLSRIKRLESTKGDGIYDKATIFVDNLVMARAVMAIGDGALVGEPPNLTFYHDTNGDGVADKSEPVTDKFGTRGAQPEHLANSPTWMLDNWIVVANHGTRYRWQDGKFLMEINPGIGQWGMTQDDWGRPFTAYNSSFLYGNMVAPQFYARNPNLTSKSGINFKVMNDQAVWPSHPTPGVNRGYDKGTLREDGTLKNGTAISGPGIYRGDLFPQEFYGNAFVPEPAGNLVKRIVLEEKDGLVTGKNPVNGTEFLTSTDERFRPVNCCTGPDGALYIVDMARGLVQDTGFLTHYLAANVTARNLMQPVDRGRIYRIVPDGSHPKITQLPKETAGIVPLLAHANGHIRDTAQRVLVERGDKSVVPALEALAANGATPYGRVHALWTLEGLAALTPEALGPRFQDAEARVRAAAVRLADRRLLPDLLKLAAKETAPEVRLQLALKLSPESGPEAEQALVSLVKQGGGTLMMEAIASGLRGREVEFLDFLLRQSPEVTEKNNLMPILARCVATERKAGRVARLLEITAALPSNSKQSLVILDALAARQVKGKSTVAPKLIYLEQEPSALVKLRAESKDKALALVTVIDSALAWPGKPGVPPPPVVVPLSTAEQALFDKGKMFYGAICAGCHQPSGAGMDGLAPPLLDSEWVLGSPDIPAKIVLSGLNGPIDVAGTTWRMEMPPLAGLDDESIASILTYIRREWEHNAAPVTPAVVAKVREATKNHPHPWQASELKPPAAAKSKKALPTETKEP